MFAIHDVVQSREEIVGINHTPYELRRSVAIWRAEDLHS